MHAEVAGAANHRPEDNPQLANERPAVNELALMIGLPETAVWFAGSGDATGGTENDIAGVAGSDVIGGTGSGVIGAGSDVIGGAGSAVIGGTGSDVIGGGSDVTGGSDWSWPTSLKEDPPHLSPAPPKVRQLTLGAQIRQKYKNDKSIQFS